MIQRLACDLRNRRRRKSLLARVLFFVGLLCFTSIFHSLTSTGIHNISSGKSSYSTRHLLSTSKWETCDFETNYLRNESDPDHKNTTPNEAYGWMTLHILGVIIIFIALAIICDDFFVPSLEAISEKLDLSEDVAGATFMAAGSSAPELFTSVAGVTADSDVGVGTIVGSAVFNLLVIIALTAALTTQTLQLDWRPLFRDSVCYALSIAAFIVFAWDAKFELYESVILLSLYFMYILLMKYNSNLMDYLEGWGKKISRVSPDVLDIPTVETVVEINEKEDTGESTKDDNKDTTPPQGRLPPLQPLKVAFEGTTKSAHSITSAGHGTLPHFSHSHKGELARSF
ncbi:sodium potassium calcium exchanger 4-like isoform X3, partial [Paramuricea clavata]